MSEETRRRCLEPFFTTMGNAGTGLAKGKTAGKTALRRARDQQASG